jgi:hypothetical protein
VGVVWRSAAQRHEAASPVDVLACDLNGAQKGGFLSRVKLQDTSQGAQGAWNGRLEFLSAMKINRGDMYAVAISIVATGVGMGLVEYGGWGPCGPASLTAKIGGYLSLMPFMILCACIPEYERVLNNYPPIVNFIVIASLNIITWLAVMRLILMLWHKFRKPAKPT